MTGKISDFFQNKSVFFWVSISLILVGVLGILDYLTGNEFSFSLFYLLPISLTAWYVNRPMGIFISILSAITWLTADIAVGENYFHSIVYFWNTLIRFGFFITVTYLISELQRSQKTIQALARTDHLTGTINSRYFYDLLESESNRSNRYGRPFTLAYLDLDNFKQVNDKFGHAKGDQLLCFITDKLKRQLRNTDIISRQGGDEFAILFPEAGQEEAKIIMAKIYCQLTEELRQRYPFVTFSAGVVTFIATPVSVEEIIKLVDDLMYSVKNSTKNDVFYSLFTG